MADGVSHNGITTFDPNPVVSQVGIEAVVLQELTSKESNHTADEDQVEGDHQEFAPSSTIKKGDPLADSPNHDSEIEPALLLRAREDDIEEPLPENEVFTELVAAAHLGAAPVVFAGEDDRYDSIEPDAFDIDPASVAIPDEDLEEGVDDDSEIIIAVEDTSGHGDSDREIRDMDTLQANEDDLDRPPSPSSRTSTPPLSATSSGTAPKKFSSISVTKKFLSKTATPASTTPVPTASSASSKLSSLSGGFCSMSHVEGCL